MTKTPGEDFGNLKYSWVDIKGEGRTIEKLRRSYFGIVGWVLDIMRGSLVVDDLEQVQELLKIICADQEVKVARGKNRFSDSHKKGHDVVGYRDLQLTVQCVGFRPQYLPNWPGSSDTALSMDVQEDLKQCPKFFAEVQIHVRDMYDFKVNDTEGHESYIEWRTMMGE